MRQTTIYVIAGLFSLLLTACKKEIQPQINSTPDMESIAAGQKNIKAESKNLVLESFTHTIGSFDRKYQFVYAPNGRVDSIIVSDNSLQRYVYVVFYKGYHIDSVNLVQNNAIVSTFVNFQYKGNLIIGFDYFFRIFGFPLPNSFTVTYDKQKRIQSIKAIFLNTINSNQEFTFDEQDDVIFWKETAFFTSANYTYDDKLNPLHFVPDLFAFMLEERWMWQYIFSLHNITTITYSSGQTVTYQNQYNSSGQLIKTSFTDNNQVNNFIYTYK
jgi:hypothetical protein